MPQLKPTRGICLNRSHPLSRGLVGFWLFNEGSGGQVFDLSGYGNTGTLTGLATVTNGKFGSGIDFDGVTGSGYVSIPNPGAILDGKHLTIVCWLNWNKDNDTYPRIIDRVHDGQFAFYFADGNNKLSYALATAGGTIGRQASGSPPVTQNQWMQCVLTYDGSDARVYLDGILKETYGTGISGGLNASVSAMRIGERADGSGRLFDGQIDHVMIWNRALFASEVALLHREPFCMFGRVNRPELIGGQIVNLTGSSVALSSLSATAKVMRKVGGNVVGTSDVAALLNSIRSLLEVERDWLREALFNGMTANAFKLGTTLSLGWFWVRVAGCSVLYRGSSMGEIDFVNILAVAEQDACEISPPSYISHNSGSTYLYIVRRFNNCGYQECTLAASVKVSIESNGELAEPQPNKVFDSGADLVDGNKIQLVWYYCLLEQKSQPMCFNVYYDGRTGQINYENPLAIIGYKGRKFYSYQCGALEAGRYLFAIRTEDASGIENSSLARLRIQFDPTNPAAIDILSVEGV